MSNKKVNISNTTKSSIIVGSVIHGGITNSVSNYTDAPLSPVETLYAKQIQREFSRYLSHDLVEQSVSLINTLARIIHLAVTTGVVPSSFEQKISSAILSNIADKEIEIGQAIVTFGSNNQFGDIKIRDIANGNIYNTTINLY